MHVGQAEVEDDHIRCGCGERDRLSAVLRRNHRMAQLREELAIEVLDHAVIFDGEDSHALRLGGSWFLVSSPFGHPKLPRRPCPSLYGGQACARRTLEPRSVRSSDDAWAVQ